MLKGERCLTAWTHTVTQGSDSRELRVHFAESEGVGIDGALNMKEFESRIAQGEA